MNTCDKGHLAELKVHMRAFEKGYTVSVPTIAHCRYDCVIDMGENLHRAQVKYASSISTDVVSVELRRFDRNQENIRKYKTSEVDCLLVYCPQIENVLWIPNKIFIGKSMIYLRLVQAKNIGSRPINYASDFIW